MLHAADLWCGDRVGGGTAALIDALDWMARQRVPVVNISLVGPANPVLRRVVTAMVARGHVLVAAAGNGGPAAPPQYPAAYPGVVAVAAVDARMQALPESASGPQIAFCAPGVLDRTSPVAKGAPARGTSYAAPLVARLFAERLTAPSPAAA
ncbi:MAG: S8 family serine peptidase, partial [Lysobacteraceae bacterium]